GPAYPDLSGGALRRQLFGLAQPPALPSASSRCGACRDVCPVKIDIPALLLHLRARVVERRAGTGSGGVLGRLAFSSYAAVMARPRLFEWVMRAARTLRILPPLRAWTRFRDLRPLAPQSFREQWRAGLRDEVPS